MPQFVIRTRNSKFHACDEGADYDMPQRALAFGVEGAIAIVSDEVKLGAQSAAVEISIERQDGSQVLCSVVALSVSPLLPLARPFERSGAQVDIS